MKWCASKRIMGDRLVLNMGSEKPLKLEGYGDWISWKFQVKVILKALDIFKMVDGSEIRPVPAAAEEEGEEGKAEGEWLKKDARAQGVIVTRLSNKTMLQITSCVTAKDMWDKLHTIYEQKSDGSVHLLQQKFFGLKFAKVEDIIYNKSGKHRNPSKRT